VGNPLPEEVLKRGFCPTKGNIIEWNRRIFLFNIKPRMAINRVVVEKEDCKKTTLVTSSSTSDQTFPLFRQLEKAGGKHEDQKSLLPLFNCENR
jgi:hypothetical protein